MDKKTDKEQCQYVIYMHTSPSGKRYIGITKQALSLRWGKNGIKYKNATEILNTSH